MSSIGSSYDISARIVVDNPPVEEITISSTNSYVSPSNANWLIVVVSLALWSTVSEKEA